MAQPRVVGPPDLDATTIVTAAAGLTPEIAQRRDSKTDGRMSWSTN